MESVHLPKTADREILAAPQKFTEEVCCAKHKDAATYYTFYYRSHLSVIDSAVRKLLSSLEAAIGIEPMNKGFAEIISHHLTIKSLET